VELKDLGPPPAWIVALALADGRRIGIGACNRKEDAERVATEFSALLGVEIARI